MTEAQEALGSDGTDEVSEGPTSEQGTDVEPAPEREISPPIESRFMFVDVAAQRAKQLRRGALPRITMEGPDTVQELVATRKLERIAIAEVQHGLIQYYTTPESVPAPPEEAADVETEGTADAPEAAPPSEDAPL